MKKFLLFLFTCFVILAASTSATCGAASADNVSTLLVPPLTSKEMAAYQKISNASKAAQSFIETRQFLRQVAVFTRELPKGVEYAATKHGSPQPTAGVDVAHALTFDEQLLLYNACMVCGGCGGAASELPPTGDPLCGLKHPKQFECGQPVDKNSVLSQLTPQATPREIELFEKANRCASVEIPRFLTTRKYIREIRKLEAQLPAGKKLDPNSAPRIPDLLDSTYFLDDEVYTILDIQNAEIIKGLEAGNKNKQK